MSKTQVGECLKKIWHFSVEIYWEPNKWENKDKFVSEELNVIAENERFFVVDDGYFTKIRKEKTPYDLNLDDHTVSVTIDDVLWGNSIRYKCYSESKIRPSTIKKKIALFVSKKYGWLSNIKLDIIK